MKALKDRMAEAMRRHPRLRPVDVARACNVTTASVGDWLNGKTLSMKPEPARLGAKLFGCDQNWLSSGVGRPNWKFDLAQAAAASGTDSMGPVALPMSYQMEPDGAPLLQWDEVAVGAKENEQFKTVLPDDALGKDYPAGTEILWSTPTRRHPKAGRAALVLDDAGRPHARWLGQGDGPSALTAVSLNPLYKSFDGVTERFEIIAVFKAKVEPDDA
jgi:hypothetical protein